MIKGKAQQICFSLSKQQSTDYEVVKASMLGVYELVLGIYGKHFASSEKTEQQTYVEVAWEKEIYLINSVH